MSSNLIVDANMKPPTVVRVSKVSSEVAALTRYRGKAVVFFLIPGISGEERALHVNVELRE